MHKYAQPEAMERIHKTLIKTLELNPGSMVVTTNCTRPYVVDFEGKQIVGTNPNIVDNMVELGELVFIGIDETDIHHITDKKYYQMELN